MMTLGQNLTLTFRRLNKKWNRYAVASLLFLLPTFLSMILSAAASVIIISKTGYDAYNFYYIFLEYYSGMITEADIIAAEIDINLFNRTFLTVMPLGIAGSIVSLFLIFTALPSAAYYLGVARKKEMTLKQAFAFALKSVPVTLLMVVTIFLWTLLFVVPGIVKMFAYSQALFIKADHPDWSASKCIKYSDQMMRGRKGKCFLLMLVLGIITAMATYLVQQLLSVILLLIISSMSNITLIYTILNIVTVAASIALNVYAAVFFCTALAIFHEDVRRSYLDDIEQDLRRTHESGGYDGGNPFNDGPFVKDAGENGSDSPDPFA